MHPFAQAELIRLIGNPLVVVEEGVGPVKELNLPGALFIPGFISGERLCLVFP